MLAIHDAAAAQIHAAEAGFAYSLLFSFPTHSCICTPVIAYFFLKIIHVQPFDVGGQPYFVEFWDVGGSPR